MAKISVPKTVPKNKVATYLKNYNAITLGTGRLFLLAGDQKVEHLNSDFFGPGISAEDAYPEHLFKIAKSAPVGALAMHLGLISKYAENYPKINYIVKMNAKTNLNPDPDTVSRSLITVQDVVNFKKETKLKIAGVGYTVYIGNKYESQMLTEASEIILEAQKNGLVTIIWMYPRGKSVKNDEDIHTIAGGAGVALCLGADFVKVKYPYDEKEATAKKFTEVVKAAGQTKVICAGGSKLTPAKLLKDLYYQINISKTGGVALGRNLHQYSLDQAIKLAKAVKAIVNDKKSLKQAEKFLK